jgi:hypothetical protein
MRAIACVLTLRALAGCGDEPLVIGNRTPHYDILLVRGDDTRCVLANTPLCFAGEPWHIHDVTLESCLWR